MTTDTLRAIMGSLYYRDSSDNRKAKILLPKKMFDEFIKDMKKELDACGMALIEEPEDWSLISEYVTHQGNVIVQVGEDNEIIVKKL